MFKEETKLKIKRNVYLMYLIIFLQGFVFYGPVATIYRQARGLSMYNIFLIESISWVLMIVFEIPWGWFADKFGYKNTIIISNALLFLSKIIFFKAYSFEMFLLERILLSLAFAGLSGCDSALLYSSIKEDEGEKIFGRYSAFSTSGFLIASILSTPVLSRSMDTAAFLTIFPYGLSVVLCLFLKDIKVNEDEKLSFKYGFKAAFKNKLIIILVVSAALSREIFQAVTVFLNQAQYIRSGIDIKYFGILLAAVQASRLISAKTQSFTSRVGENNSLKILYMIIALSCFVLIVTSNPVLSVLCVILISISISIIEPIVTNIENRSILSSERVTILSIYAMVGDLIGVFMNPLIGRAADISVQAAFMLCFIAGLLSIIAVYIYIIKQKKTA